MAPAAPRHEPFLSAMHLARFVLRLGGQHWIGQFSAPCRPSVLRLASELTDIEESPEVQVEMLVPAPEGTSIADDSATGYLQLKLNPAYARRSRRTFGDVGEIQVPDIAFPGNSPSIRKRISLDYPMLGWRSRIARMRLR